MSGTFIQTIPTTEPTVSDDPDVIERLAAQAAVASESGAIVPEPDEPEPAPAPAPTSAPAPTPEPEPEPAPEPAPAPAAAAHAQPGTVPHTVFAKVNSEKRQLEEENLYLAGQVAALKETRTAAPPAPAAPPEPPKPTVAEQIKEQRKRLIDAAALYDTGDNTMSAAKLEEIRGEVDDAIADLRTQAAQPPAPAPAKPTIAWSDEQMLERQATDLHATFPYLDHMNKAQTLELRSLAMREANQQGRPYGSTVQDTARLREHVADLSNLYGPRWLPNVDVKAPAAGAAPAAPAPAPAAAPGLSPKAAARSAKLALADSMPPNTSAIGGSGKAETDPSDAQISRMSDDEIAALPAATRQRLKER